MVIAALRQFTPELAAGALLTIDTRRSRVRLLPLQTPVVDAGSRLLIRCASGYPHLA